MSRADKYYKNSPRLEKDKDGKPKMTKESEGKKEDKAEKKEEPLDVHQKHAKDRLALFHKHEKEFLDLQTQHLGDLGGHEPKKEPKKES